jgi:biopolymer transport protein TolR
MKRHRRNIEPQAFINLTSLLDVTFNLLIVFFLIAPTMKHGIKMELPEVQATSLETKKSFTISIQKRAPEEDAERIYLDEKRVDMDELEDKLQAYYSRDREINVVVEADKGIPYGTFVKVIALIQDVGITNIGIATEAPRGKATGEK